MRIAILGSTSEIAKDLILSFAMQKKHTLYLFARRPQAVEEWLSKFNLIDQLIICGFELFSDAFDFDVLINFVGIGNPAQAEILGPSIMDTTYHYDNLALNYIKKHNNCKYIFLSSGAAYGKSFNLPADANTCASFPINDLNTQDWYGRAKFYAECCHRALPNLAIVDIRVFNYFSHTQNMNTRFFMSDIVLAIKNKKILTTYDENFSRDYIHPNDFFQLIEKIINYSHINLAIDCYSKAKIDKFTLLEKIHGVYNLEYKIIKNDKSKKFIKNYYSINNRAETLGYIPFESSLSGIFLEMNKILNI